jgi:hypothetical protein
MRRASCRERGSGVTGCFLGRAASRRNFALQARERWCERARTFKIVPWCLAIGGVYSYSTVKR